MDISTITSMAKHAHDLFKEKQAKRKDKDEERGHLKPGTSAMIGALLGGPAGAAAGAEVGRRGRATEGSPAIRAYLGSLLGIPAGALAGAAGGALIGALAKKPGLMNSLRIAAAKRGVKGAGKTKGFWKRRSALKEAKGRLGSAKSRRFWDKFDASLSPSRGERAGLGAAIGGGAGAIGGYFEGARRGAESVGYTGKK